MVSSGVLLNKTIDELGHEHTSSSQTRAQQIHLQHISFSFLKPCEPISSANDSTAPHFTLVRSKRGVRWRAMPSADSRESRKGREGREGREGRRHKDAPEGEASSSGALSADAERRLQRRESNG